MSKYKFIYFIFILLFSYPQALAQQPDLSQPQLRQADQLFAKKKYMESLAVYEDLFQASHQASPSMLMKMAYIYEALGDYTQALYYLNLHYVYRPSHAALVQMENIAQQHRLQGYERSDLDIFKALYHRYFMYISSFLLFICLFAYGALAYRRILKEPISPRYPIILMTILALVFFLIIFSNESTKAIIKLDNTYLMNAPSAGANVLAKVSQGHRVEVLGRQDVWTKIIWKNQEAFIKESQLLFIND